MNKQDIEKEIDALKNRISGLEDMLKEPEYVDLGLPSGILWAKENEDERYTFDDAVETFGDNLPKLWQLCELWENCKIKDGVLVEPNGKSIKLPSGYYWSSTTYDKRYAYFLYFNGSSMRMLRDRSHDYSVRLCKSKK